VFLVHKTCVERGAVCVRLTDFARRDDFGFSHLRLRICTPSPRIAAKIWSCASALMPAASAVCREREGHAHVSGQRMACRHGLHTLVNTARTCPLSRASLHLPVRTRPCATQTHANSAAVSQIQCWHAESSSVYG